MSEKEIGDYTFRVNPPLATKSLLLKNRIMKALGGGLAHLPAILRGFGEDATPEEKEKSDQALVSAFNEVFTNGDPEVTTLLMKDIVECAEVAQASGGYAKVNIDQIFTGKDKELFECLIFVVKDMFGDFLGDALANGGLKIAAKGAD